MIKEINDIDDVYWLMKKSSYARNALVAFALKFYIENEQSIKIEIERTREKAVKVAG